MAIAVSVVGFDTAKNVFQVHRMDRWGETVLRRRLRRSQVADFFQRLTPCLIGMEATRVRITGACAASLWARRAIDGSPVRQAVSEVAEE